MFANAHEAADVMRLRLQDGWTRHATHPIIWQNFSPETAPVRGWLFARMQWADERQITLGPPGSRDHRDFGAFHVAVAVPRGEAIGLLETMTGEIVRIFKPELLVPSGVRVTSRRILPEGLPDPTVRFTLSGVSIEINSDRRE